MGENIDQQWHHDKPSKTGHHQGLCIADTLDEIKHYAYSRFGELDHNGDGFITRAELKTALDSVKTDWRAKSFITFLLRRIDDIRHSCEEEWAPNHEGISRGDIQEYFRDLKDKL